MNCPHAPGIADPRTCVACMRERAQGTLPPWAIDRDRVCDVCSEANCTHCDLCDGDGPIVFFCALCHVQCCGECDRRDGHPEPGRCWCEYDDGSLQREKTN